MDDTRAAQIRARLEAATPDEEWRPVAGSHGYEVSDQGRVRSWWKRGGLPVRQLADCPHILSGRIRAASGGYASVSLPGGPNGNYRSATVHRLVAAAFHGPCPDGMEVAHLNGDCTDNRAVNLAYVTHVENEQHKKVHGTWDMRRGGATLSERQVSEIKSLLGRGFRQSEVARVFNISRQQINDIARGKTWPDVAPADLADLLDEREKLLAVVEAADAFDKAPLDDLGTVNRRRRLMHAAVRAYRATTGEAGQ